MATVTLMGLFDFARTPSWTTLYVSAFPDSLSLSSSLDVSSGGMTQDFQGNFKYDSKDLKVSGKVTSFTTTVYEGQGWASYTYSDAPLDAATLQKLLLTPNGAQAFQAYVLAGNDKFIGLTGGVALGYAGNDVFYSAAFPVQGAINGGSGNDTYVASSYWTAAVVADLASGRVSSTDPTWKNVLTLSSVENLIGTYRGDVLGGNAGVNRLDGRAGVDTVTYASSATAVQVDLQRGTASGGGGNDVLVSIENVIGSKAADVLIGSEGVNVLNGGLGADTLQGGAGNDTYVLERTQDVAVESSGGGTDTIRSTFGLTLKTGFEHLVLLGSADLDGLGNASANQITGTSGDNSLRGAAGSDTLDGGSGADRLHGGTQDDRLLGGAGNDTLDGAEGHDTMAGGAGNDRYLMDAVSDVVTEGSTGGLDIIFSSVGTRLPDHVENLTLAGSANLDGTGNALGNVMTGNRGANVLSGGAGIDTLVGGVGNDRYVVDHAADRCIEVAGGGTDSVHATVSYVLGTEIERLVLVGSAAVVGTGNALANELIGNGLTNTLNGGLGQDTMSGGAGNDVYVVDNAGDRVVELSGQGTDAVHASLSWTLGAALENLVLSGNLSIDATATVRRTS